MKKLANLTLIGAFLLCLFAPLRAHAAATLLPNGEQCFSALAPTSGGPANTGTGFVGLLGTITGGSGGTNGTYGGVALTGGSGTGATANITVSGGAVTAVAILNPGKQYVAGDVLSASSASIGGTVGFSVPVSSVAINQAVAGGTVAFYIPNTSTFKQTWFNADQSVLHQNTNPVQLDANGCAIIYGTGSYRQVLQDSQGNTIWDQITTDTSAYNSTFWAGVAGGTANVITLVDPGFNATDGSVINFTALFNNTGATTINPSSFGAISTTQVSVAGPVALTANTICAGCAVSVIYRASTNSFQILSVTPSSSAVASVPAPQGYLTLSSDQNNVVISTDITGATTVYYTPYVGNQVPVWNGVSFQLYTISQLTLSLTASFTGNTIYDACVFINNSGIPTLVAGPAWSNSGAGTGARGTGAGSAQIQKLQGLWVNSVQITGLNGANSYTISANQCTYVGSLFIDNTAGQISDYVTAGQSRKWGTWNAYNRQKLVLQAGDGTTSWPYSTATIRASNGNSANSFTTFSGLPEEPVLITFNQMMSSTVGNVAYSIGIGVNSTTAYTGTIAQTDASGPLMQQALYALAPGLGINTITSLEDGGGSSTQTFFGSPHMLLQALWRG